MRCFRSSFFPELFGSSYPGLCFTCGSLGCVEDLLCASLPVGDGSTLHSPVCSCTSGCAGCSEELCWAPPGQPRGCPSPVSRGTVPCSTILLRASALHRGRRPWRLGLRILQPRTKDAAEAWGLAAADCFLPEEGLRFFPPCLRIDSLSLLAPWKQAL